MSNKDATIEITVRQFDELKRAGDATIGVIDCLRSIGRGIEEQSALHMLAASLETQVWDRIISVTDPDWC